MPFLCGAYQVALVALALLWLLPLLHPICILPCRIVASLIAADVTATNSWIFIACRKHLELARCAGPRDVRLHAVGRLVVAHMSTTPGTGLVLAMRRM